jgi:hypothetical protein
VQGLQEMSLGELLQQLQQSLQGLDAYNSSCVARFDQLLRRCSITFFPALSPYSVPAYTVVNCVVEVELDKGLPGHNAAPVELSARLHELDDMLAVLGQPVLQQLLSVPSLGDRQQLLARMPQ